MTLLQRLEAALALTLLTVLRSLGPVTASNLGGRIARSIGPLLPVSRVADRNLRLAMPRLDAAGRKRIVRGVWDNLGRIIGELPHIARLHPTPSGAGWEFEGCEILPKLAAAGGPVLVSTGHIGNWEVLPAAVAEFGIGLSSVYRPAENPSIDRMIQIMRLQIGGGVPWFPKGAAGARQLVQHLTRGGAVMILIDQKMNDGIEARFFGQPAMTAPGLAALALRFRCPVVPMHVERIGPARFRVVCEEPLGLPDSGDRQADIAALTQTVNDRIECWIRARPESWLWLHRRWPK